MLDYIMQRKMFFVLALLLLLIYFPIFLHLDYMPIRQWDESILGINAIEMKANHNYIVTYFFGSPETSNCKPPLAIWCMVLSSKIFGLNELAFRLPSAIAALMLCVFLFFAVRRYTRSAAYAFIVVLVLVTSQGYIHNHITRTGEYDSLLVLFSTLFALNLFFAVEAESKTEQSKYLLLFFLFFTLGLLTKGIACVMQAPGLLIYVLLRKKLAAFLRNWASYTGFLFFIVFGLGYYFLREYLSPGYIKFVWLNELGGRFGTALEGHQGSWYAYLDQLIWHQFTPYIFLLPAALIVGLKFLGQRIGRLVAFAFVTGSFFVFIISIAQTKLGHYDAPVFPYLAIITASIFLLFYRSIQAWFSNQLSVSAARVAAFALVLCMFAKPYLDIVDTVYFPKGDSWEESLSNSCRYFQYALRGKAETDHYQLLFNSSADFGKQCVLKCYEQELMEAGISARIAEAKNIKANSTVVVFDSELRPDLEQRFEIINLKHLDYCNADVVYVNKEKARPN
jgi:4-amino-4-deoxy-L-arabinose transferase-like glycosyltransferase